MDQRPHELEAAIDQTRGALDRDLNRLGRRIDVMKDDVAARAQWWAGIAAVGGGVLGAIWFWPRQAHHRRRVLEY